MGEVVKSNSRLGLSMRGKVLAVFLAFALTFSMVNLTAFADTEGAAEPQYGTSEIDNSNAGEEVSSSAKVSFITENVSIKVNNEAVSSGSVSTETYMDFYFTAEYESGYTLSAISAINTATNSTIPVFSQGGQFYIGGSYITSDIAVTVGATYTDNPESQGIEVTDYSGITATGGNIGTLAEDRYNTHWDYIDSDNESGNALQTGTTAYARVYTPQGFEDVLENYPAITYVEFGNDISLRGTGNERQVDINTTRPSLVINARNFVFTDYGNTSASQTIRAGVAGGTATNLAKITFRKFNVPDGRNNYGLIYVNNSGVKEVEFDGLNYSGPQLAYAPGDSNNVTNFVFNGESDPITMVHRRQSGTGSNVEELLQHGNNVYLVGSVDYEKIGARTPDIFQDMENIYVGEKPSTPGSSATTKVANTSVYMRNYSSAPFMDTSRDITIADDAVFKYLSGNAGTSFTDANIANLTVGRSATFDVTTTGNLSTGSVRVAGNLTVGEDAAFKIQANASTSSSPALYTQGSVSFNSPNELLIYSSGTGNAVAFRTGQAFKYSGEQLAYWNTRYQSSMPTYLDPPTVNWLSNSGDFGVTATTSGTGGAFTSFNSTGSVTGYEMVGGSPSTISLNADNFSWNNRTLISNLRYEMVEYRVEYRDKATNQLIDQSLFSGGASNVAIGESYSNIAVRVNYPSIDGYVRSLGQPTNVIPTSDPSKNTFVVYYEVGLAPVNEPGVKKTAERTGQNEWEVTLTVTGKNEEFSPMTHLDLMIVIDTSGSMGNDVDGSDLTRLEMAKEAAFALIDNLVADSPVTGDLRIGLAVYQSSASTIMSLEDIGDGSKIKSYINGLTSGAGTNIGTGVAQGDYELYQNNLTYRDDTEKYMVLLGDGEGAGAAVANSNTYKNKGGKLICVSMFEKVPVLNQIQNSGYYECSDEAGFTEAIKAIQETLNASALATGIVTDPMGPNFEIVPESGDFDIDRDVKLDGLPSGGSVTLHSPNPQTLKWTLEPKTSIATMTYKVRMKDTGTENTDFLTNGETVLDYTNPAHPDGESMNFEVPKASYDVSILNTVYDGELPSPAPTGQTYKAATYGSDARLIFDGPEDIYTYGIAKIVYNGNTYSTWDAFVADNNVQAETPAGKFSIPATFAESRDLEYHYTRTTIPVDFVGTKVKDLEKVFEDPDPAEYGFDNWPAGIDRDAFDVKWYRHTGNENAGTYNDELRAEVTVKPARAGEYMVTGQPGYGKLTITAKPLKEDVDLVATGEDHVYNRAEQRVAYATTTAEGTIEYSLDDGVTWQAGDTVSKTDVGAYKVKFKMTGTGNYSGEIEAEATGNITAGGFPDDPKDWLDIYEARVTYNEQEQVVTSVKIKDTVPYTGKIEWTKDDPKDPLAVWVEAEERKEINASTYSATYRITGTNNYVGAYQEVTATGIIEPSDRGGTLTVLGLTTTYNGSEQTVATGRVTDGSNFTGHLWWSYDQGVYPTDPNGGTFKAKDAGTYTIWFKLEGYGNYKGGDERSATGYILKADLPEGALVATPHEHVYDGTEKVVASAEILAGSDFTGKIEYTLSNDQYAPDDQWIEASEVKATESGDYPVWFRLIGDGNYSSTSVKYKQVTGKIAKQELPAWNEVIKAEGYEHVYNKAPQLVADAVLVNAKYTGDFEYQVNNGNWESGDTYSATNVGDYNVKFRFTANGNYSGSVETPNPVLGKITPLDISKLDPNDVFTVTPYTVPFNGKEQVVASAMAKEGFTGDFKYSTNILFPVFSGVGREYEETNVGDYPVRFQFTGTGNYSGTAYLNTEGHIETPNFGPVLESTFTNRTYNKELQVIATSKLKVMNDPQWTGTLEYQVDGGGWQTFQASGVEVKALDAGNYFVEFRATGNGNFAGENDYASKTVTISKHVIDPNNPDMYMTATGYDGHIYDGSEKTIAEAALINGTEGTFTYSYYGNKLSETPGNGPEVKAINADTYTITYTLTGTGNYEGTVKKTVTGKISPKVINPGDFDVYADAWGYTETYDGSEKTIGFAQAKTGITGSFSYQINSDARKDGDTAKKINAGDYNINFEFTGSDNYSGTAAKTVQGKINPASFPPGINVALIATPYTSKYDGSAKLVASAATDPTKDYTGDIYYSTDSNWSSPSATWVPGHEYYETEANDYPVAFKIEGTGNYAGALAYATTTGKIEPKGGEPDVLEVNGTTKVYNGQEQVIATAKVKDGVDFQGRIEYTLDGGTSWEIGSEYKQTNAGDYQAWFRIVGTGSYIGLYENKANCSITQAPLPDNWKTVFDAKGERKTYTGDPLEIASAWVKSSEYQGDFQYSDDGRTTWKDGSTYSAVNADEYPVYFRFTATGNYKGTVTMDEPVVGIIDPAKLPTDPDAVIDARGYKNLTYNELQQLVADARVVDSKYTGSFEYSVNGGPWTAGHEAYGIEAGTYNVHFRFTADGNYEGSVQTKDPAVGEIKPFNISTLDPKAVFTVTGHERDFTGGSQVVIQAEVNDPKYTGDFEYAIDWPLYGDFKAGKTYSESDVGDYAAQFKFVGSGNYSGELKQMGQGKINEPNPTDVLVSTFHPTEYTGNPQVIAKSKVKDMPDPQWTGTLEYQVNGGGWQSFPATGVDVTATDAGDYEVEFRATGTGNFAGKDDYVSKIVTISKKKLDDPDLHFRAEGYQDKIYDGTELTVAFAELINDTTGTFTYVITGAKGYGTNGSGDTVKAVDADTYTITYTLTGTDNYEGTVSKTVTGKISEKTINPGDFDLYADAWGYTDPVYDGTEKTVAFAQLKAGVTGDFSYVVNTEASKDGDTVKKINAGDYSVTYTLTGTGNYKGTATKTVQGKINPAKEFPIPNAIIATPYTQTYSGFSQMVASAAPAKTEYTGDISYTTDTNWEANPGAATWIPGSIYKETDEGEYPVGFRLVGTGNYEGSIAYAGTTGKIDPYKPPVGKLLVANGTTVIYNGEPQTIATARITDPDYKGTIQYTLDNGTTWIDGAEYKQTNAGDYKAVFRVLPDPNYSGTDEASADCSIKQADVPSNWEDVFETWAEDKTYTGNPLDIVFAKVKDPKFEGSFQYSTDRVVWKNGATFSAVDAGTYDVYFRFTATGNYKGTVTMDRPETGVIKPGKFDPDKPELYMEVEGYKKVYNKDYQVIADAQTKRGTDVTGTFEYSTDNGVTWTSSATPNKASYSEKDVNVYPVIFRLTGNGNYEGQVQMKTQGEITKAQLPGDDDAVIVATGHSWEYNQNPQTVVSAAIKAGTDYTGVIEYTTDPVVTVFSVWHKADEYKETNVGKYPAIFRLTGTDNYEGVAYSKNTGEITQADLPDDPKGVIDVKGYSKVYNKNEQVVVDAQIVPGSGYEGILEYTTDNGQNWTKASEFKAKDVGNYPVTFRLTGTGNYKGSVSDNATGYITQADLPDNPDGVLDAEGLKKVYNKTEQVIATAKIANGTDYEGIIKYSIDGTNWVTASEYKATAVGEYPVRFRLEGTGNYKGSVERDVKGEITPADLPDDPKGVLAAEGLVQTYDNGNPLMVAHAMIEPGTDYQGTISYTTDKVITPFTKWIDGSEYFESDQGEYPVTFKLTGTGNYKGEVTVAVTGKIERAQESGNLVVSHYVRTYNEQPQVVAEASIKAGSNYTGTIAYSLDDGLTWIEQSQYKETEVGTYPVKFRLTGTGNYDGIDELAVEGKIIAQDIDITNPDLYIAVEGYAKTYNGSAQTIAHATPASGSKVTGDIDYSIDGVTWVPLSEYQETNVGTYPVTFRFTATGNYKGSVTKNTTGAINQADLPTDPDLVIDTAGYTKIYNGSSQTVADAKVKDGTGFTGTFSYSVDNGATWIGDSLTTKGNDYKETNVGTYPVIFKFVGNGNYQGTVTKLAEGKIDPANLPEDLYAVLMTNGYTSTYDGTQKLVADAYITDPSKYTGVISYTTDNPMSSGASWTTYDKYHEINAGDYDVTFRFSANGNYTGSVFTTAKGTIKKAQLSLDGSQLMDAKGYTNVYTGRDQIVASATKKTGAIQGYIESSIDGANWSSGTIYRAADEGSYPVQFRFVATGNYEGEAYTSAVGHISPAPIIPPQDIIINPPNVYVNNPPVNVYPGGTTVSTSGGGTTVVETGYPVEVQSTAADEPQESRNERTIEDEGTPIGGLDSEPEKWSLINLIIALVAAVLSVALGGVALFSFRRKNQQEQVNEEPYRSETSGMATSSSETGRIPVQNRQTTTTTTQKESTAAKVIGAIAGILGLLPIIAFFIVENFTATPAMITNGNTPLIIVLTVLAVIAFIVYAIVKNIGSKSKTTQESNYDDRRSSAATGSVAG